MPLVNPLVFPMSPGSALLIFLSRTSLFFCAFSFFPKDFRNSARIKMGCRKGGAKKGVRERGCNYLILWLSAFVCICSRLHAFHCVLGPISVSLKSAFVCVCAHLFAFISTPFIAPGMTVLWRWRHCTVTRLSCRFWSSLDKEGDVALEWWSGCHGTIADIHCTPP